MSRDKGDKSKQNGVSEKVDQLKTAEILAEAATEKKETDVIPINRGLAPAPHPQPVRRNRWQLCNDIEILLRELAQTDQLMYYILITNAYGDMTKKVVSWTPALHERPQSAEVGLETTSELQKDPTSSGMQTQG